ncbi:MAG: aminopeptidase N C-terminal domain-containing protein, partial [Gammaproteobacteria bacterium]|nr:aminopeptidase N C-terminal domain-containing protein [Gammaproteobacteria bacterium]
EASGRGYRILSDAIIKLNKLNPQMAARMCTALSRWRKYNKPRQDLMKGELNRILKSGDLAKDVFEVVSKSLEV